jgi:hypothetical protein
MILVDFEEYHARQILDGHVNDERIRPPVQISQFVHRMVVPDMSFSGFVNGQVIACGGIYPVWDGVGEAWFLGSQLIHKHKAAVTKAVKRHLVGIMEEYKLHRVQAHVMEDWPGARRWISFLGMQEEGVLRKFSPEGLNYIQFARVV